MSFDESSFKEKLESQHQFPGPYIFKFIAPEREKEEIVKIMPKGADIKYRESSKGKYVSVTVEATMESSEAVIAVYVRASTIKDVIAL